MLGCTRQHQGTQTQTGRNVSAQLDDDREEKEKKKDELTSNLVLVAVVVVAAFFATLPRAKVPESCDSE